MPQLWESNIKTSDKTNKQNEHSSFILTHGTQRKDHDIWRWKSSSWLGTGTKVWWG